MEETEGTGEEAPKAGKEVHDAVFGAVGLRYSPSEEEKEKKKPSKKKRKTIRHVRGMKV